MSWGKEWAKVTNNLKGDWPEDWAKPLIDIIPDYYNNAAVPNQTLILERKDGTPISVAATIVGDLAIHDAIEGWGFRVTHVPTLTEFDKAVPKYNIPNIHDAKKALIEWCKKVQSAHSEDWAELRALTPDFEDDKLYESRLGIRDWCLSVEV